MNTETVKQILSQYRTLQGEYNLRKALHPDCQLDESARLLKQKIDVIEAMLLLLTEEERFVIIKHLGDKLSWSLLVVECEKRWGFEQARHVRTLTRFQSQALEKIAAGIGKWKMASQIEELFQMNQNLEESV